MDNLYWVIPRSSALNHAVLGLLAQLCWFGGGLSVVIVIDTIYWALDGYVLYNG